MFKALLAQNYDYSYSAPYTNTNNSDGAAAGLIFMLVLVLIFVLPSLIGLWKVFSKAGKPGWAAIVPVYNWVIWLEIVGRPISWLLVLIGLVVLSWIPILGFFALIGLVVYTVILSIDLAKSFGKDTGFGVLIALLPMIGLLVLGFGSAKYVGPSTEAAPTEKEPPYPSKTPKTVAKDTTVDKKEASKEDDSTDTDAKS